MKTLSMTILTFAALLFIGCGFSEKGETSEVKSFDKVTWYCTARDADDKVLSQEWVQGCFDRLCAEHKFRKQHPRAKRLYCI